MKPAAANTLLAILSCVSAKQDTFDFIFNTLNNKIKDGSQDSVQKSFIDDLRSFNLENLLSPKKVESYLKELGLQINSKNRNVDENEYEESLLNVTERIAQHGYIAQEYSVETQDGYLLGMQRIRSKALQKRRVPILLMHGLLESSSVWLDGGPQCGLAFLLARAGYDVWLGNSRGNYYSRRHTTFDPDSNSTFWQFSSDEIAKYDLPPLVDKVLFETGTEKLIYIGYSQGGGTLFMLCSEDPQFCNKMVGAIAIAPSGRHLLTKSFLFKQLVNFYMRFEKELYKAGIFEALPKNGLLQQIFNFMCRFSDTGRVLCTTIIDLLDGRHPGSFTKESIINMASNFPSGTSVQNMVKYGQALRSRTCRKYDYGPTRNLQVYGSSRAPRYNLSAVTAPVLVVYGRNDDIVDMGDIEWLMRQLPNAEAVLIKDPFWNHLDVVYSQDVPTMLFPVIEQFLMKYETSIQ